MVKTAREQTEAALRMASQCDAVLTIAFDKDGVCQYSRIDYWPQQANMPALKDRMLQHVAHIISAASNEEIG